jgi:hypothetical protein
MQQMIPKRAKPTATHKRIQFALEA